MLICTTSEELNLGSSDLGEPTAAAFALASGGDGDCGDDGDGVHSGCDRLIVVSVIVVKVTIMVM